MTVDLTAARRAAFEQGRSHVGPPEAVALTAALGRVLARPVRAACSLPPFTASAMDGWVVCGDGPWRVGPPLRIGEPPPPGPLKPGTARPIVTGAPVPPGPASVLRSERGRLQGGLLTATAAPQPGADIRTAGEEVPAGEVVLEAGSALGPAAIALAAACGVDEVLLAPRPVVDLVLTGSEIDAQGVPGGGRVRDVFGPSLPGLLAALGCGAGTVTRIGDDPDALQRAIIASTAELLITTGGTGGGPTDHLRAALQRLGCTLVVHGVAMRPGHPALLARRVDGRSVLALPGNPFAAFVALLTVGVPLIDGLGGRSVRPSERERTGVPFPNPDGRSVRIVAFRREDDGIVPVRGQGPAMLTGLVHARGLALVPPGGAAAGATVETLALPW